MKKCDDSGRVAVIVIVTVTVAVVVVAVAVAQPRVRVVRTPPPPSSLGYTREAETGALSAQISNIRDNARCLFTTCRSRITCPA